MTVIPFNCTFVSVILTHKKILLYQFIVGLPLELNYPINNIKRGRIKGMEENVQRGTRLTRSITINSSHVISFLTIFRRPLFFLLSLTLPSLSLSLFILGFQYISSSLTSFHGQIIGAIVVDETKKRRKRN